MAFFGEEDLEQLWLGRAELPEKFNALREASSVSTLKSLWTLPTRPHVQ
jgi:hypothetical protein